MARTSKIIGHRFFLLAGLIMTAAAANAALVANSQTFDIEYQETDKQIVLGQGVDLTFRILIAPQYGQIRDFQSNIIDVPNPDEPVIVPKDASHRAVIYYDHNVENLVGLADSDNIIFEVTNAGPATPPKEEKVSAGNIGINIRLHPVIEFFAEDPEQNPAAAYIGRSEAFREEDAIELDTTLLRNSLNPDDRVTVWGRASDATGRVAVTSQQYLVDNLPPTLTFTAGKNPGDNAVVNGKVQFKLTATDNIGVKEVRFRAPQATSDIVLTQPALDQSWTAEFDTNQVPNARHNFKFEAVDVVNLVSPALIKPLNVDNLRNPIAVADLIFVREDIPMDINVLANDSHPDGHGLSILSITGPGHGTAAIVKDQTQVHYIPSANYHGADTFTYIISDGHGGIAGAAVNITVTPENDAPTAFADIATTQQNQPVDIDVIANDQDVDGDVLSIATIWGGNGQKTKLNAREIRYVPLDGATGVDTFYYSVTDGHGGVSTATVTVGISASSNAAPVARDDIAATNEDTYKDIEVLVNDTDEDGDALILHSVTSAAHGAVSIHGSNMIRYTPAADYYGDDSFGYTISDGQGHFANATVHITVQAVDDNPRVVINTANLQQVIAGLFNIAIHPTDDGTITSVVVSIDGQPAQPVTPNGGVYNYILNTYLLASGREHTVLVTTTDNSGNTNSQIMNVHVDNMPFITVPNLNNGMSISKTHTIDVDPTPGTTLTQVEIYVDDVLVAPLTVEPFVFPWNTNTGGLADGSHSVVIRAHDATGRQVVVSRIVTVNNTGQSSGPRTAVLGKESGSYIAGEVTLRVDSDPTITAVTFYVDGVPQTTVPVDPSTGHYDYKLNTQTLNLTDGPHTIKATYTKLAGGIGETPAGIYVVDNTPPTITKLLPDQAELDRGLFGTKLFRVDVRDPNGGEIDKVEFFLGGIKVALDDDPSDNFYEFTLNTNSYPDNNGAIYQLTAIAYDKAGNPAQGVAAYSFTINNSNPPYAGRIKIYPKDKEFIVTPDGHLKISVTFIGETLNGSRLLGQGQSAITVNVTKDGRTERSSGTFSINGNTVVFNAEIPENSTVDWILNDIRDRNENLFGGVNTSYSFTHGMSKARGGLVTTADGRFKLDVPPDALPENMLVTITNEERPAGGANTALGNFESVNPGQSVIAGPFMVRGVNASNVTVLNIQKTARCFYAIPAPANDLNSPRVFQVAELFDNGKVFPLGSVKSASVSPQDEPIPTGDKVIGVDISRFGRFIVTSQVVPEAGLTHFYNFPNPFNPNHGGTDFHYFLGADSSVKIVIYDLFGQQVRDFDIPLGATGGKLGLNLFTWNGRNGSGEVISNGGYIARIQAEDAQGRRSKATYKVGVLK